MMHMIFVDSQHHAFETIIPPRPNEKAVQLIALICLVPIFVTVRDHSYGHAFCILVIGVYIRL